ncbi:MAG: hypothetical protein AAGF47_01975 [Planctomycetota bacterium]
MNRAAGATLVPVAILLVSAMLAGCGDAFDGDRPTEVRVQRILTAAGDRIVSYTAMYDDGIETYLDYGPDGVADLITVERDGANNGAELRLVRDGAGAAMPADGPEPAPVDEFWQARFRAVDALVDEGRVPWSDSHGLLTPRDFGQPASPAAAGQDPG